MKPNLVLSDSKGHIFVHPTYKMLGADTKDFHLPLPCELIALPKGSTLFFMPAHAGIGWDEERQSFISVEEFQGKKVFAVSAFMIPGFTRLYLPAARKLDKETILPLWPYTAVGWFKGKFYVAAIKVDHMSRQRPAYYRQMTQMNKNIEKAIKEFPENRLLKHLSHCALQYNCRNAQNLFLKRWEAPLPISPACNSRCLGCISFQDAECGPASHERIRFVPKPQEVFEVAAGHLSQARQAMVSFGQGCEGEPLLEFKVLKESISLIRKKVHRGTIHLNTNGSNPLYLKELASLGLNSVRISLNSLNPERYEAYYRPKNYRFNDVLTSIACSKKSGLFVSLNFLVFPGFSDSEDEVSALIEFLKKGHVDLLQLRNLSIDPEFFKSRMPVSQNKPMGIFAMISLIRKNCPRLRTGYFNLPKMST